MHHDGLEFHNVGELRGTEGGRLLQRVPEAVRSELNEGAARRMRHPAGVEIRFVPDGPVELTLSTVPGDRPEGRVEVFWGPIQGEGHVVGDRTTLELSPPEELADLRPEAVADLAFDPRVCRVRLPGEHRGGFVRYHGVSGDVRPPRPEELPDRRYLAYGTSITEGEAPSAEHLTYASQTARRLGADLVNLGSCGTAYCDRAMADHIASESFDVATLSLSVNMVGTFSPAEFRERAARMIDTVAGAHPDDPVAAITLFPHTRDVLAGNEERELAEEFREILQEIVAGTPHDNVVLLEGPELLPDVGGLTTDLVHPGDDAMIRIGENLAGELEALL
ncbi:SGNH/GDSL hydrolase family protein [Saliphagus infecundisoli]|uniref:SGNH/GDSL hydrolase family protein n=1 Tax=Saliphagus infecundisoli TaxID=1849069 RepID=A0ABD5QDV1_9EURY|nr:SGNH/GDSL hydrolase family protein [Saliphagus infecundisoli]